jgi:alcohol dehydrogenase (NADP+)
MSSALELTKHKGWRGHNQNVLEEGFVYEEYEPKTWDEDDVEIAISHCGVCGFVNQVPQ